MGVEIGKKVPSSSRPPGRRSPEWTARVSKRLCSPIVPYTNVIQHACFAGSQHAPAAPPLLSTALRALSARTKADKLTSEALKGRSVLTSGSRRLERAESEARKGVAC